MKATLIRYIDENVSDINIYSQNKNIYSQNKKISINKKKFNNNYKILKYKKINLKRIVNHDPYYIIAENLPVDEVNIILLDLAQDRGIYRATGFISIYVIHSIDEVRPFLDCDLLWLRGDYPIFDLFLNETTAKEKYIYTARLNYHIPEYPIGQIELRFDYSDICVYYDDIENTEYIQKRGFNQLKQFVKPVNYRTFYNMGLPRVYDVCFIASNAPVKRIDIFKKIVKLMPDTWFITAGFVDKELELNNVKNLGKINKEQLNILYNISKIQIVCSDRDSNPRVIQEGKQCGTYVICGSHLNAGKFQADLIIDFNNLENEIKKIKYYGA